MTSPWTQEELRAIAEQVLALSKADATEVVLDAKSHFLSRFANSQIHQNVFEQNLEVHVRVAFGHKVGRSSTTDLSAEGLSRAVSDATLLAKCQMENPEFPGFALPMAYESVHATSEATLAFSPGDRAAVIKHVCRASIKEGLNASGAFATGLRQLAIANSNGLWAYHASTMADFNTVVLGDDSSGWATATHLDASRIDGEALAEEAVDKALRSRHPQDLEPGEYPVILEESAVANLAWYLATGASGEEVRAGRSFMSGRHGAHVASKAISLWDDGLDPTGLPCPFDYEGTPKRKVTILENGTIGEPVHDLRTAQLAGTLSTGHAIGASAFMSAGVLPSNLFMAPGTHTKEEMLETCERGIWVTRFHYVNRLDPRATTITGMTRDGTFLIENGKLVKPLRNLRFTQSILEAFQQVDQVGLETKLSLSWNGGGVRVPALKLKKFRFSGKTAY